MFPDATQPDGWSRVAPVVVAALLVLSGCQAVPGGGSGDTPTAGEPTAVDSTTDNATTEPAGTVTTTRPGRSIKVTGGPLPVDPNEVWTRVAAMLETDVGPPSTVRVANLSGSFAATSTPFERALGVPASNVSSAAGLTSASDAGSVVEVHHSLVAVETRLETTLAHEYVHAVQFRTRVHREVARTVTDDGGVSPDDQLLYNALIEGAAEYVEQRYAREHLGTDGDPTREQYLNATSTAKRLLAPYYLGTVYVNATVDGPGELETVYEQPPQTTEELLHGLVPGSEPPAPLSVSVDTDRRVQRSGPYGELYVRTLFGTALDEPAAARLADGWGNDTRLEFEGSADGKLGDYAWVLRWDDAANATEFENGVSDYLDARDPNASVRTERVAPETTVLFAGSKSFVAEASASGENATVTVSL